LGREASRSRGKPLEARLDSIQFFLGQFLDVQQCVLRRLGGADQFIEFQLYCFALPILGVANEEDHQKSDDVGDRVDDEQPSVAKAKQGSGQRPDHNDADGEPESHGMSARPHHRPGKFLKAAQQLSAHQPFQLWSAVVFHFGGGHPLESGHLLVHSIKRCCMARTHCVATSAIRCMS
jgi:hypothetical protein